MVQKIINVLEDIWEKLHDIRSEYLAKFRKEVSMDTALRILINRKELITMNDEIKQYEEARVKQNANLKPE